uniref:NFACT-C domain-containing protein n=1 Tax=Mesocestoides corti TaxID=53468 RepID=A0A5K3F203_MESCO
MDILVDLDCTALQNAKKYYSHRRQAEAKEQKTIAGTKIALKVASKKAEKTRKEVRNVQKPTKTRKPFWFEKFHWFISSENYLVLAGRDAAQNENLVKRHFRQHDIYVHADVHGASSVIVKARRLQPSEQPPPGASGNEDSALPQPPMKTLIEAGHMAVALSNAWSAKVITNAWWVRYEQVSKTAPTGEYLPTGSFVIRGRKHMLPQCHLAYGIAILFKLGDDSVERHLGERCIDLDSATDVSTSKYDAVAAVAKDEGDSEADDAELTTAFRNVSLNLNVNRIKKSQPAPQKDGKRSNTQNPPSKVETAGKRTNAGPNPLKRGQKAKMKRIRQKYGDQDDEERQMRLKILQGANAKLSVVHDIGKAPHQVAKMDEDDDEAVPFPPVEDVVSSDSEQQEEVEEEKVVVAVEGKEEEDEGVAWVAEESPLETLTGQPVDEDTLLFALPFCAPYSALAKYKYKAKLIPGTQKRGKITKLAIQHFSQDKAASQLEKQLIQCLREEDVCRVLPGPAKITFLESQRHA